MKKLLLSVCLLFLLLTSGCAQNQYGLQNGQLYFKQQIAGALMVNENGEPLNGGPDTLRFIYVEVKGRNEPVIEKVIQNGKSYAAAVFYVAPSELEIGTRKGDGNKEVLQPKAGNKVWKLELTPLENNKAFSKTTNHTTITGKLSGRPFTWQISKATELAADERY